MRKQVKARIRPFRLHDNRTLVLKVFFSNGEILMAVLAMSTGMSRSFIMTRNYRGPCDDYNSFYALLRDLKDGRVKFVSSWTIEQLYPSDKLHGESFWEYMSKLCPRRTVSIMPSGLPMP